MPWISSEMLASYLARTLPTEQIHTIDERSKTDPELAARLWLITGTARYSQESMVVSGADLTQTATKSASSDRGEFDDLLARLREGDQSAAALVVDRYTRRLVVLARANLDRRILRKEDPEDVLQSVFQSFFRRCSLGQFQLDSREDLWALLVSLTLHKCGHLAHYFHGARRDIQREAQAPANLESSAVELQELAREPSPVEAAMLAETLERLLAGLKPYQQEIVRRGLEGEGTAEIAEHLGVTRRSVQRVLQQVRKRLEEWRGEAEKS
jgi:RNA polymerase sigma-70 factor (ECF subfamily)